MSEKEITYSVERKSKVYPGGSENSVRTTIPEAIAILLHVTKGDKIKWVGEAYDDGEVTIKISKLNTETNK